MTIVQWLHLTDLHIGQSDPHISWPIVRSEFLKDLKSVRNKSGAVVDLVLFTGDLTFSGGQFSDVTQFLGEVWGALDSKPGLLAVPGNHDVSRPSEDTGVLFSFDDWKPDVQELFWSKPNSDVRRLVGTAFSAYTNWITTHPFDRVDGPLVMGEIPGDFATTFSKEGWELGIVGLNTAFRQLRGGDYRQKLVLHARQLSSLCGPKYPEWLGSKSLSLLLTHHPPSWLSDESRDVFRSQIATKDYFALHLCGHQHKDETTWVQEGKHWRRLSLGRALYGRWSYTDYEAGGTQTKRLHGYSLMQLKLKGTKATFRQWPRKLEQTSGGDWEFLPNTDLEGALRSDDGTVPKVIPVRPRKTASVTVSKQAVTDSLRAANEATQVYARTWLGTLQAATAIAEGLHSDAEGPRHTFELMRYEYGLAANGDQLCTVTYHLRPAAGVAGVQLFRHFMSVEPDAPAAGFLHDVDFLVRDLDGGEKSVAYLQTVNEPRAKRCALFLLPEVVAGQTRRVEVKWRWPRGFAKLLETGEEKIELTVRSAEPIAAVEIVVNSELPAVRLEKTAPDGGGQAEQLTKDMLGSSGKTELAAAKDTLGPSASPLEGGGVRWLYRLEQAGNGIAAVKLVLPK